MTEERDAASGDRLPEGLPKRSRNRWYYLGFLSAFLLLAGAVGYSRRSTEPATAGNAEVAATDSRVRDGEGLWRQFCAACHEPYGGGATPPLGPALISREYLAFASDERIDSLISYGIPGTTMSGWGRGGTRALRDAQVQALVAYLRSMAPTAPSDSTWRRGRKESLP